MSRLDVQAPAEAVSSAALAPPRPNPGPEPWRDDFPYGPVLIASVVAVAFCVAWRLRTRRGPAFQQRPRADVEDSAEARLLALGEDVRGLLARKLGQGLRARTTEEILADPQVIDLLGTDQVHLAAILGAGDRVKFGSRGKMVAFEERLDEWTSWVGGMDARLRKS